LGLAERASKAEPAIGWRANASGAGPRQWQRPAIDEEAAASDAFAVLLCRALAQIAANAPAWRAATTRSSAQLRSVFADCCRMRASGRCCGASTHDQ